MANEERYYAHPGPIAPLALVDHWLGIWLMGLWNCYKITHYEPIPKSRQFIVDCGPALAGAWTAALDTAPILQQRLSPPEAFQVRFYPIDDIEVLFAIGNADPRFMTSRQTARADIMTIQIDPFLHSTEVVILTNSSPFLTAFNPAGYVLAQTRTQFFGYRYSLDAKTLRTYHTANEALAVCTPAISLVGSGGF